jgi:putative ABC transport system substrate-binding protein
MIKRREFMTLLGGAAAAWPLAARAQQADVMRRIGLLMGFVENSADGQRQAGVLRKGVGKAGLGGPWCVII